MITSHQTFTGGLIGVKDKRDYKWQDVGGAISLPFDWNKGYDIEKEFGITLKTKNQFQSYSCGGQAFSYYAEVLSTIFDKHYDSKSARFIYSQVFVPDGGSTGRDCLNILVKQGMADEVLLPSYAPDGTVTEAFMRSQEGITSDVKTNASKNVALAYAQVNIDIDTIAQAIRDNHGCVLLVQGTNNGTWLSPFPSPSVVGTSWNHWLYAYGAEIIDGKKMIKVKNSWGNNCGNNGTQWLREGQTIFQVWTMIYNDSPPPHVFKYTFTKDIWQGQNSDDVIALQTALQIDGCFSSAIKPTGYYGTITAQAVKKFQEKYNVGNAVIRWANGGKFVGSLTRVVLNKLFS